MMGQMFDTVIVAGSDKEWVITTHQNLLLETVLSHLKF